MDLVPFAPQEEYLIRIRSYIDRMSETERKIADYIIANADTLDWSCGISELAERTNTSISTVVRFCRTLGFAGFSEFKFYIKRGHPNEAVGESAIESYDSAEVIKQKVSAMVKSAIDDTILMMDDDHLEKAITAIAQANTILICGEGGAAGVAQVAAATFLNIGKRAIVHNDALSQLREITYMRKNDVVIGICKKGQVRTVIDVFRLAKKYGVTTIAVTERGTSLLTQYSDIVLCTCVSDRGLPISLQATTLCQLLTLQLLQVGMLVRNYGAYKEKIEELYDLMDCRQYPPNATLPDDPVTKGTTKRKRGKK